MKKIIAILTVTVLMLSLCACQKNDGSDTNSEESTPTVSEGADTEDTTKDENKTDDENSNVEPKEESGEASKEEPKEESGETPKEELKQETGETPKEELKQETGETSKEEPEKEPVETPETESEEESGDDSKEEADNYFINNNNNIITANELTIRPRHVYWENGKLVAKCFIINGTSKTVNAVKVNSIEFSNTEGIIAVAGFGILENAPQILSNGHIEWTFVFGTDCIENAGANLKSLGINFDLEYLS